MNDNVPKQRYLDLLADRALFGLSESEEQELEQLQPQFADVDADEMDRIVALIESSSPTKSLDQMPASVREKVLESGEQFSESGSVTTKPSYSRGRDILIAVVATAATFLVVLLNVWKPAEELNVSQRRDELIRVSTDLVRVDWTPANSEDSSYGGEVIWSDELQKGFMSFRGLPANDPKKEQYQLWIFDAKQDEKYPIDGGVFDITASGIESASGAGDTIVEIDAKLMVEKPSLFAITIEKPGGVVVSDRSRLPLLAKVP